MTLYSNQPYDNGMPEHTSRRVLFLLPFPPRLDATHGGGRAMAQLVSGLAERHQIGLLYLRAADEPPIDSATSERCELVEEICLPFQRATLAHAWLGRIRSWAGLVRGTPLWALDRASRAYAARVRAVAQQWQP